VSRESSSIHITLAFRFFDFPFGGTNITYQTYLYLYKRPFLCLFIIIILIEAYESHINDAHSEIIRHVILLLCYYYTINEKAALFFLLLQSPM